RVALSVVLLSVLTVACAPAAAVLGAAGLASASRQASPSEVRLPLQEPATLDPALSGDLPTVDVVAQLFDGLVARDQSGTVVPAGAESWTVSPDGLTYAFALRQGAAWSDGRPVTASDYAY